jgi:peptidoglycan/xylan/chitin deacetylase (PgdA/CDA1 family)
MLIRILKIILASGYYVWKKTGALFKNRAGHLTVVTYHAIHPEEREKFARHLDEILKSGQPVLPFNLDDQSPGHCIAVTFDDGFENFRTNALPLLLEKKIPVTVFIPTGYMGCPAGWIVCPNHKNYGLNIMSREQVAALDGQKIVVGSHSVSHPRLGTLKREKIFEELVESRKELEKIVPQKVSAIAFPYGSYNDEVIALSGKAGYTELFFNVPFKSSKKYGTCVYGRIDVSIGDWIPELKLKFLGAYDCLHIFYKIKQILFKFKTFELNF